MRESKVTILWDIIRHLLVLVSTLVTLYFLWTRIHWLFVIIVAVPVYFVMRIIFAFLTLPFYSLTPESKLLSMAEKALDKGDSGAKILEAYERGELRHYTKEIESLKQVVSTKPNFAEAHCDLGKFYGELGRYTEAIESLKQAIRIKPNLAEAHNNLGIVYGLRGLYTEAIEAYKQAIFIKPGFAEAHFNLGVAYSINGDKGSALEEYKILKTVNAELANKLFNMIYE